MSGLAAQQTPLARLLYRRSLAPFALSQRTSIPQAQLQAISDGDRPSPGLLRVLAPALNLHTADLFVIAELPVPDDLTPLDGGAGRSVASLVRAAAQLPSKQRHRLHQIVCSLPQAKRRRQFPPTPAYDTHPPAPGAMILRLLRNRNLDLLGTAKCLAVLTPHYLAASTIGRIGRGDTELTTDLLASFAALLAISAEDLAALTDLGPPGTTRASLAARDVAALIWEARRLTASQVEDVVSEAGSMLHRLGGRDENSVQHTI
ncbi:XRE family transcriptional regulator [Salinispora fenicalii]|uniref:XRE family transcriptional regulator n=1 Tax=Salinispora fenicalii TaxID=1137263 RepID=UPI001CC38F67|nr:XRE family transcriptional regulator [Salinispora fenicalii]